MKRLVLLLTACMALIGASVATTAHAEETLQQKCAEQEALAKYETEGPPFRNLTAEEKAAFVEQETAQCRKELQEAEARAGQREAEAARREEREAVREAEKEAERRAEKRMMERERRQRLRVAARHRREWAHKPTVTEPTARYFARRLMNESEFSVWTVDCGGGKINRTHWSCSVHIFYHCLRGRIRVSGAGFKDHEPYFDTKGSELRPCTLGDGVLH